jgi:sec-independent protein translocase protein TatC
LLALPVLKRLPHGQGMISIDITAPFLTPFKFATVTAVFLVMPYFLYQLWHFIAPALYQRERRLAFGLFLSSVILFYFGTAFAYVVVLPLALHFFIHAAPSGVVVYPDITHYLDFALTLFSLLG